MAEPAYTPLRLPATMSRADIGPYMRSLREHYTLSQQDVSERLHIRGRYVYAIEAGEFDALPGQVYAKGYVHTYAEFLGLDAEQVVGICFGSAPVRETQQHFIPETARDTRAIPRNWWLLAALLAVGIGLYSFLTMPPSADENAGMQTQDVPESMLASIRNALMPQPFNHDCLTGHGALTCFFTSRGLQWLTPPHDVADDWTAADALPDRAPAGGCCRAAGREAASQARRQAAGETATRREAGGRAGGRTRRQARAGARRRPGAGRHGAWISAAAACA